jgi:hypothetical protein
MEKVKCFLIVAANKRQVYLRRYSSESKCPTDGYIHDEMIPVDIIQDDAENPEYSKDQYPKKCSCGYEFLENDVWQRFPDSIYRRVDTGEEKGLREWAKVPGAMYNAAWLNDKLSYTGPDGQSLVVILPNGKEWIIDSPARNCSLPDDKIHKCWVRHGIAPDITVDKNGHTCSAGAGSILVDDYHGFLRNGFLETC